MDQSDIAKNLIKLNGWSFESESNSLVKSFSFKSYLKTIAFVNAVAWIANKLNHHPDLVVSFNQCIVKITTHDKKSITDQDFSLAQHIDQL